MLGQHCKLNEERSEWFGHYSSLGEYICPERNIRNGRSSMISISVRGRSMGISHLQAPHLVLITD
jgi:hypothetical protein